MASVIWHSFNPIRQTSGQAISQPSPRLCPMAALRAWLCKRCGACDFILVGKFQRVKFQRVKFQRVKFQIPKFQYQSRHSGIPKGCTEFSGLYNLGTGQARSFYDLAAATFKGMDKEPNIEFIDMPEDIRDKYQYFTEANMQKLRQAGYDAPFTSLEDGVGEYVRQYLVPGAYL